jgi:hypothetical protein
MHTAGVIAGRTMVFIMPPGPGWQGREASLQADEGNSIAYRSVWVDRLLPDGWAGSHLPKSTRTDIVMQNNGFAGHSRVA